MKKILKYVLLGIVIFLFVLGISLICYINVKNNYSDNYSSYEFTKNDWESGNSVISFGDDGDFAYYGYEGNAIDDYDFCEKYTYNEKKNIIKLDCSYGLFDKKIKILSVDNFRLKLNIDGKDLVFRKLVEYDEKFVKLDWERFAGGKEEKLSIWSDGSFSYTYKKVVDEAYFDNNMNNKKVCDGFKYTTFYLNEEEGTYDVWCPIKTIPYDYYLYDSENNIITLYSMNENKGIKNIKILDVGDRYLELEYAGVKMKFER